VSVEFELFRVEHACNAAAIVELLDVLDPDRLFDWVCEAGRFDGGWDWDAFGAYNLAFGRCKHLGRFWELPWQSMLKQADLFGADLASVGTVLGNLGEACESPERWTVADSHRLSRLIARGMLGRLHEQNVALSVLDSVRAGFADGWMDPGWSAFLLEAERVARAELADEQH